MPSPLKMNSRIPPRPISTPSPLAASSLDEGPFSERGLVERSSGSVVLRSSGHTPTKSKVEGEIEKVKVYARIRPALREDETPGALVWSEDGGQLTIFRPDAPVPQSDFSFDKVLGPSASQVDVYNAAVSDVVADVLRGYNGTILAYGQTGAGKTYTLGNTAPDAIGMIPRAAAELFSAASRDAAHMYRITMSYIQIYMEMIQDLLNPTADNLPIREDAGGVFVAGACEVPVTSLEECLHYLELGDQNRVFAFTHLNAHSSRSHAVVMLTAVKSRKYLTSEERAQAEAPDQDGVVTQKVTVGKLYMVDLAGSERLKKSKSVGLRATEARSINLSLTMLGMCISARAQDSPHVPFRDSKLTRLLQESLGGNAKTSLILCLSDVRQHVDESLQSLQFGARAARVCNKPVVNERLQMRQLTAELLAALEEGNERSNGLEAALTQTKEERDALQAALARERARSAAIVEALRAEARTRDEQAAAKLAEQAELISEHVQQLGQVQQQQGQLEQEVAELKEKQRRREDAHRSEVSELQERLAELQAAAAAERQALEAEARSQQLRLAALAHQQAAALSSQLAAERAAAREQAASIHLALTRLQRALGELVAGPAASEDGGGAAAALRRRSGGGRSSDGGGGSAPRPGWMTAGLAAAAAAAAAGRRGVSSGSAGGDSSVAGAGGGSAVQLIQQALGLTEASSDSVDGDGAGAACIGAVPPLPSRFGERPDGVAAGSTAAAIASLVGGEAGPASGSCRELLHPSESEGATSAASWGSLRERPSEQAEGAAGGAGTVITSINGRQLCITHSGSSSSMLAAPAPGPHHSTQQQHQQQQRVVAVGGAGGGRVSVPSLASHVLAASEIADLDAALAAAQQDLLADLRAVAAASGSGHGSVAAASGWQPGVGRPSGPAWPLPSHATAAAVAPGAYPGQCQDTAAAAAVVTAATGVTGRQALLSPLGGRGSLTGGSYASEYAAAVASGTASPGRQCRSYCSLHGSGAYAAAINGPPGKPPRAYGNGDGSAAGALRDDPSGYSFASVSMPCPPSADLGDSVNPTASNATLGCSHSIGQGPCLSTPFMEDRGRQAAAVASPSPTGGDTAAAFAAAAVAGTPAQMNLSSSALNLNPAFDTFDSAEGLKPEEVLSAAVPPPASAVTESGGTPSGGLSASAQHTPTASGSTPPLPMFTGIQVQLDALLDMAAALRRVKTALEARVVAQACELARRQEEQQRMEAQSRGDLQAVREALAAAESQLASTTQELDSLRLVLAETVNELGRTRRGLDERGAQLDELRQRLQEAGALYDTALMRLGETRGRLDEAAAELQERRGQVQQLESELERTKSDLVSERAALARSMAESARSQAMTTKALAARHELQRQVRAANTIKRAYKAFKLCQLRGQVVAKQQALQDAEAVRRGREALQAARAGQALVQESMGVIRDAVGSILAAFVGRRHQLEAAKSLQERLDRMMSQGGAGAGGGSAGGAGIWGRAAGSSGGGSRLSCGGGGGGSKGHSAASGRLPRAPTSPEGARAAGSALTSAGGASRSASMQNTYPHQAMSPTARSGRRQMSAAMGLMLSAVTLPQPPTPTSASTAASTGRPAWSVGGARPPRPGFPPLPLQIPDDTATSAASSAPPTRASGAGFNSGGGGVVAAARMSSSGGGGGSGGGGASASHARGSGGFGDGGCGGGGSMEISRCSVSGVRIGGATLPAAHGLNAGGGSAADGDNRSGGGAVVVDARAVAVANGGGPCSSSSSCSGVPLALAPRTEEAGATGIVADAHEQKADAIEAFTATEADAATGT